MPYLSKLQARWAHATRQPFAKRRDTLTDFGALPEQKDAVLAIAPHVSNALFNQPGMQRAKRLKKRQTCTCTTKAATGQPGELIRPGVRRIRGNLCNVHGRYGACDTGSGKKPAKGAKPKAPKQTPEQRATARSQQRQTNIDSVAQRMADTDTGLAPAGVKALVAFDQGTPPDATTGAALAKMGLAEQATDGSYRMTPTGRAAVSAMEAGDYQRAIDTISRGADASGRRQERVTAAQARQQGIVQRRAAAQATRAARAAERAQAKPKPKPKKVQAKKPTADGAKKPVTRLARRRASSASSGGSGSSSAKPKAPKASPVETPAKPTIAPALTAAAAKLSAGETLTEAERQALLRNGLARLDKDGNAILTAAGLRATQKETFTVFKDARGNDRWLSITTTAYEDSDQEWISTKAIARAVAAGDAAGQRGPLRYWHVPGMDFGDCDFQAQAGPGGRFLIESGTFRSKAAARFGQQLVAKGYQMSPGFVHARDQPIAGVFDDIVIYERSPVPAGRAANRFTRFALKEDRMLTNEKEAELKSLLADQPDLLATLLSQVERTDKAAQAAGVTHKDADPPAWAAGLIARLDVLEATTKAMAPASMEQAAATEFADAEAEQVEDGGDTVAEDAGMDDAAFAGMIAQAVVQAITPLLDIEKKMASHLAELKTSLGGMAAQKDDATAKLAARVDQVEASVKSVAAGEFPTSLFDQALAGARPYRASEARVIPTPSEDKTIKEAVAHAAVPPPAGLTTPEEQGVYQLLFG